MNKSNQKLSTRFISLLMILTLSASCFTMLSGAKASLVGDLNGDGDVTSADALLALQCAVGKITLGYSEQYLADVDISDSVSSADALMILQKVVGKISKFPKEYSEADRYYYIQDKYYGVNGKDFTTSLPEVSDIRNFVKQYADTAEPSDVETYTVDDDGRLINNYLTKNAIKYNPSMLTKYADADFTRGQLKLDSTVMNYAVPTDITAYDLVPVYYELYTEDGSAQQTHIEVNAFEEPERYAEKDADYFDLSLPGKVRMDINFLGYEAGITDTSQSPVLSKTPGENVSEGTKYPEYNASDLTYSGTMPVADTLWFNFEFTNTGNTILDSEGNGSFDWYPVLYKKGTGGGWEEYSTEVNRHERLMDYMYPGESSQMTLLFTCGSIPEGEYKIVLNGEVKCEHTNYSWMDKYTGGASVLDATFAFTVSADAAVTEPLPVDVNYYNIIRNNWLATHEEFMTSYKTFTLVGTMDNATKGIMYVQPACFTENLTVKLMHKSTPTCKTVNIPVNVDTDSLSVELNTSNENWVETADGTREPMLVTQEMASMRGASQISADSSSVIINDLLNMKDEGINTLSSTIAFSYETKTNNTEKFMMDIVRSLGCFNFIGYGMYPYSGSETQKNASNLFGSSYIDDDYNGVDRRGINKANGLLMNWSYVRYGDMYYQYANGSIPIVQEDSRGWLTLDHDWRMDMSGDHATADFYNWLEDTFGSIKNLNSFFGSSYSSFSAIDPRTDGAAENQWETFYNYTDKNDGNDVFVDWSNATLTLDAFRTLERVKDYESAIEYSGMKNAKMWVMSEALNYIAPGLNADTTNAFYRSCYYQSSRSAVIPEILLSSDSVSGVMTYNSGGCPSEVYELVKACSKSGLAYCSLVSPVAAKTIAINSKYGDNKCVSDFNLKSSNLNIAYVDNLQALYPILKATYEAGGIPGVMTMDYYCNLYTTSTQYKELKFYTQKIKEMLATDEGAKWASDYEKTEKSDDAVKGTWSYTKEFIEDSVKNTKRYCVYTDSVYVK